MSGRKRKEGRGRIRLERRLEGRRVGGLNEGREGMRMVGVARTAAGHSHSDAHHDGLQPL